DPPRGTRRAPRRPRAGWRSATPSCARGLGREAIGHGGLAGSIAPIADGRESAQGHEEAAAPDPVHEGLVVDAHAPGTVVDGLAERYVEIAQESGVDVGFRHRLPG